MTLPRFGSRKFFVYWFSILLLISLPVLYFYIGINITIQLFVLGTVASVTLGYHAANVLDKGETNVQPPKLD